MEIKDSPFSKVFNGISKFTQTRFFLLFIVFAPILFNNCTSQRKVTYFRDMDKTEQEKFVNNARPEYRLQKQDILYVKFITLNNEINDIMNGESQQNNQNMMLSEAGGYFNGYSMNDSGFIQVPLVGFIKVLDLTLPEATAEIANQTSVFVKDAAVTVKLMNYKFTILGEVKNPGTYGVYTNVLTVPEALGKAGDITEYGNHSNILLIRSEKNGYKTYHMNLQQKDILGSELFYVMPNDLLIIEPMKSKFIRPNILNISGLISTIASTISLFLLINRL